MRPASALAGIGRAHQRPPLLIASGASRTRTIDGPGRHELGQAREERARAVHGVEALGLRVWTGALRRMRADREARVLDALKNPAGQAAAATASGLMMANVRSVIRRL